MRMCHRCAVKMVEGFDVKIEGAGYGIKIAESAAIFAKRMEKPKVAICPKCCEISLYIDGVEKYK